MNCKQGDLAMIVGSKTAKHNGMLVDVLEFVPAGNDFVDPEGFFYTSSPGDQDAWLIKSVGSPFPNGFGSYWVMHDSCLRPIRPGGTDEDLPEVVSNDKEVTA